MGEFLRDLRYSGRTLAKSPGFLLIAVLSIGLGIGANAAIFGLVNALILRALPVPEPSGLVLLTDPAASGVAIETRERGTRGLLAYVEFLRLRAASPVFSGVFAAESNPSELDAGLGERNGQTIRCRSQLVSSEFFPVLGLSPAAGRFFTAEEDTAAGAHPVAVISHGFWERAFARDPAVVGKTIRLGSATLEIVGVSPAGFRGIQLGAEVDVWAPITMQRQVLRGRDYLTPRDTLWLQVGARLAPRVSRDQAEAGINVAFQQVLREWAPGEPSEEDRRSLLNQKIHLTNGANGASPLREQFADPLLLLMATVGLVLLIACANIANLVLARASGRQRETGIRLALGAGRIRLIRQQLTESLVVAALGGIAGVLLAFWGTRVLLRLVAAGTNDVKVDTADPRVFIFTGVLTLLTGLLFGLLPAIRSTRVDVNRTLGSSARGSVGDRGTARTGRLLVIAQVALSLLLLVSTMLFARSFQKLIGQKLGIDRDHLLMVRLDPSAAGYKPATVGTLYQELLDKLHVVPGIRNVTISNVGLFSGDSQDPISLDGSPIQDRQALRSRWTLVGPRYFSTVGIPLLRGREMDDSDAARATPVCVVNETFARRFFPNLNPIGRHVTDEYPTTRETYEIIGVAADSLEHHPSEKINPRFYATLFHPIGTVETFTAIVSASGDPAGIASSIRSVVAGVNPNLPVLRVRTVNEQIDRGLVTERLIAELTAFFGVLALILCAIGLYGVMSYSIARRTSEIGVRMALGASSHGVLRMVMREALALAGLGVLIGLPCSLICGRLAAGRLYGITPADPLSIGAAVLVIAVSAALAAYVPARRATRVDPMSALRCD